MRKLRIGQLLILALLFSFLGAAQVLAAEPTLHVVINYKPVVFTAETGYPFVDENNRTMVPLRGAMESMGANVGWDEAKQTAIVIYKNDRIEITLGEYYLYNNNIKYPNDTAAVSRNGRVYLPLKAVLESADFTVEFDSKTNTVNAYDYEPVDTLMLYETNDTRQLMERLMDGDVVYVDGRYYATPEFSNRYNVVQMNYLGDDLNTAIYPEASRYDISEEAMRAYQEYLQQTDKNKQWQQSDEEWISLADLNRAGISLYAYPIKGFFDDEDLMGLCMYDMSDLPDDFLTNPVSGVYNGIKIKVENDQIYFWLADLQSKLAQN